MEYDGPWMRDLTDELEAHYPGHQFPGTIILDYESDWRLEVANGNTLSGLKDWIMQGIDGDDE